MGMGRIGAALHCLRTTNDVSDKLNMCDSRAARKGAPIFKNKTGMLFSFIDVGRKVSTTFQMSQ